MKFLFTTFCLFFSFLSFSQSCLPDENVFSTQVQIDSFPILFPNCTEIAGHLRIEEELGGNITDLTPLSNLQKIGGHLMIGNSASLLTLAGLENIVQIDSNLIINLYLPTSGDFDLQGLMGLENIGGDLSIVNTYLQSLNGLDNLKKVGGNFYIQQGNNFIENFNGLSSLDTIGGDISYFGSGVITFEGLENLKHIGGNLDVNYNSRIENFMGLNGLTTIGGRFNSYQNSDLISLEGLENLSSIGGDLFFMETLFTNLDPLQSLNFVGSDIRIKSIYNLTSIEGLAGITHVHGDLEIALKNIPNLSGLENITAVDSSLVIIRCHDIENLNELSNISSVGKDVVIGANQKLINLNGLENISIIPQYLNLNTNHKLENIDGLQNVHTIGGDMLLWDNQKLTNVSGFSQLTSFNGTLEISYNLILQSLDGLDNFDYTGITDLIMIGNAELSLCATKPICDYLENDAGPFTIEMNAEDCNTEAAIEAQCLVPTTKISENIVSIYPNPFDAIIHISSPNAKVRILEMQDISGKLIHNYTLEEEERLDFSNLVRGIYFIKMEINNRIVVEKVFKK